MRNAASQRARSVHLVFQITFNSNQCRCIHINWNIFNDILYTQSNNKTKWTIPLRQINIKKNDNPISNNITYEYCSFFSTTFKHIINLNNLFELICSKLEPTECFRPRVHLIFLKINVSWLYMTHLWNVC